MLPCLVAPGLFCQFPQEQSLSDFGRGPLRTSRRPRIIPNFGHENNREFTIDGVDSVVLNILSVFGEIAKMHSAING